MERRLIITCAFGFLCVPSWTVTLIHKKVGSLALASLLLVIRMFLALRGILTNDDFKEKIM